MCSLNLQRSRSENWELVDKERVVAKLKKTIMELQNLYFVRQMLA